METYDCKEKKPFMRAGLLFAFFLGLSGCGGSNGTEGPTGNTNRQTSSTAEEFPSSTVTTDSIEVTRESCTPFGNPPRPRTDILSITNPLICSGGGKRLADWVDAEGTTRQACAYIPSHADKTKPLPLVFWLQGSLAPAEIQLELTNILSRLATADLTGDPERPGFILVELAGRITDHYYPAPNNTGTSGWDVWDRQLSPDGAGRTVNGEFYPQNLDAAAIDHYIEKMTDSGLVDTERLYMMGWSNGAGMAMTYAMNRPTIAAAAVYSAPNPFDALSDPCGQVPVAGVPRNDTEVQVFNPGVPLFHIIRHCDIYSICPTGVALNDTLQSTEAASMEFQIINELQSPVNQCLSICGTNPRGGDYTNITADLTELVPSLVGVYGIAPHALWPTQWTEKMFTFLKDHPNTKD